MHYNKIKPYSKEIGLDHSLIDFPKTKEQADALLKMQEDGFVIMELGYLKMHFDGIKDPTRDQESANKKLQEIIAYCESINSADALTVADQLRHIELPEAKGRETFASRLKEIRTEYTTQLNDLGFASKSKEIADALINLIDHRFNPSKN
jgi:hypothetical protein